MKTRLVCFSFFIFIFILEIIIPKNSYCAIYKYLDANGTPCFADNLQVIPEQYRSKVEIVADHVVEKEQTTVKNLVAAEEMIALPVQEPSRSRIVPASFSGRLLLSIVIIVCAVVIYFVLVKVVPQRWTDKKERNSMLAASRFAIFCIAVVSIGLLHASDAMTILGIVGDKVQSVQQSSAEKGKKAADSMKQIDRIMDNTEKSLPSDSENK